MILRVHRFCAVVVVVFRFRFRFRFRFLSASRARPALICETNASRVRAAGRRRRRCLMAALWLEPRPIERALGPFLAAPQA